MTVIIPRWEWRTFTNDLKAYAKSLTVYGEAKIKKSQEYYILSQNSNENVKIREDLIDIKSLKNVNSDKLEQWDPIMKEGFPVKKETLTKLFNIFNVKAPAFQKDAYTYQEFLDEVIKPCPELKIVEVKKNRFIYSINGCAVEYAETEFNGVPLQTACVEHVDPAIVMKTVTALGLTGKANVNYIRAMKEAVGMKYSA